MKITNMVNRFGMAYTTNWFARKPKSFYAPAFVFLFATFLCNNVFGLPKTFTGTGNFSDVTKWNLTLLPIAGDNITINGICTIDNSVLTDNIAYGTLVIGTAVGTTLNWIAGGTNRLNVTNISSSFAGSNLDMTNGGTLIVKGTITTTNLIFTPGSGTIERQLAGLNMADYTSYNNLKINTAGTITTGTNLTVNGTLNVTSGTLSAGAFSLAVTGTTTVNGTLIITSAVGIKTFGNLIINGTFDNITANEPITISGNLQNNGNFNQGTGRVTFTGNTSNTISGTAAPTAFGGGITLNKGTSIATVLDIQSVITILPGGLTLTNGMFKLSSASTIIPFNVNINVAPYLIPGTTGFWCNGGTISAANSSWSIEGLVRLSSGTLNIGTAAGNLVSPVNGGSLIVDGGSLNVADRISNAGATWTFTMTGGTVTVPTVSNVTGNRPPFNMNTPGCSFNMSGGTLIIKRMGGIVGEYSGYYNIAGLGTGFTGGTLQIGDVTTPAGHIMRIVTTSPIYNLTVNGVNAIARIDTFPVTVTNNLTITAGELNTNTKDLFVGGNFINDDIFTASTGTVTFIGTGTKTVTGTSTTAFNKIGVNKGTNFTSNIIDVQSLITLPAGALTLTNGTFKLSSNSTLIPFIADITTSPFRIPATAGLWVNGGTVSSPVNLTVAGLVRVSNGTFTLGDAADENLISAWATIIMDGGAFNIAGRFVKRIAGEGSYFTMTGGTMTLPAIGSTSATVSPFMMDESGSSFTSSGGTIIIPKSGASNLAYVNLAATYNVTGGTLQIGDASTPAAQTFLINSSAPVGNLTINATNSPIGQLTTNSLTVADNVTISGGTLNSNNLNFTVGGDWTKASASTYTQGTGTVTFNGGSTGSINGTATSQTFNHVIVSKTAGILLNTGGSTTIVTTNNLTETTGDFTAPATLNITGNLLLSAGTFTAGTLIRASGNWTNNGGTFIRGLYQVLFNGTGAQSINGTATAQTFYNVGVIKTAGTLLNTGGSTTTLTVSNFTETTGDFTAPTTLTIEDNATLNAGTFIAGTTINVGGNWINNGGTFTPVTSLVIFYSSWAQAIKGTATSQTFYNLEVAKTAGATLSVIGSTITLTTNNLTETTDNFTAPATLNINGNLLLSAGTFTAGTTTNVKGNWTKNGGTFIPGTNTVNFIGTATKTLGGTNTNSFYNLTLNTVALADKIQLTNDATVTSVLNLTKGVLDLNSESLFITSGLAGAIIRTSGYILSEKTNNSAKIIWSISNNSGAHTFPFGTVSGSYIPFILDLTAGNIGNVTLSTYPTAFNNTPYPSTPVSVTNMYGSSGADNSANVVDRFWQVDKDGASGTATMTFTATSAEMGALFLPTAQRYESSTNKWQLPLPGQTNTATSATVPNVTTFSPWTMSSFNALLPIKLLSFAATLKDSHVDLQWSTASESNNDYFTVEKTLDFLNYETVVTVDGSGNSMQTLNYYDIDTDPYYGVSYYRLKQTAFDSTISYSKMVTVEITAIPVFDMNISPNPATDNLKVSIIGANGKDVSLVILDVFGRECYSTNLMEESSDYIFEANLRSRLAAGEYLVMLSCGNIYKTKKLMMR